MSTAQGGPPSRSSSRVRAPDVAPVVHAGVRYEPLRAASSEGLTPGVYVTATQVADQKRLWTTRVWAIEYDPRREADVQNVFVKSLTLDAAAGVLHVVDEKGRQAQIAIGTGSLKP